RRSQRRGTSFGEFWATSWPSRSVTERAKLQTFFRRRIRRRRSWISPSTLSPANQSGFGFGAAAKCFLNEKNEPPRRHQPDHGLIRLAAEPDRVWAHLDDQHPAELL